jgi:hypothetical protein
MSECLLRHFPKKGLRPVFLHGKHGHQDFLPGYVDELAFPSARWRLGQLHLPARWRSASFSLRSTPLPEWKSATPLDWTCCYNWPVLPHLASQVAIPHTVRFLSLGVCQGRRLRTTRAKCSPRIETAHHCHCDNHKQGHVGESLDRNGLSDWHVPCDTGFPHWVFVR